MKGNLVYSCVAWRLKIVHGSFWTAALNANSLHKPAIYCLFIVQIYESITYRLHSGIFSYKIDFAIILQKRASDKIFFSSVSITIITKVNKSDCPHSFTVSPPPNPPTAIENYVPKILTMKEFVATQFNNWLPVSFQSRFHGPVARLFTLNTATGTWTA